MRGFSHRIRTMKRLLHCAAAVSGLLVACVTGSGCHTMPTAETTCCAPMPKELRKVSLPTYVIEPPDVLVVNTTRVVPLPPYRITAMDSVILSVAGTKPEEPIAGLYVIQPNGEIPLGFNYGS